MILAQVPEQISPSPAADPIRNPILIGGSLHVLNPYIEEAIRKKDSNVLLNRAGREIAAGAQALSINLGPGKMMAGLTPWVVETLAGAVEVPLFISSGVTASSRVLEKYGSRITINAVTANSETLAEHIRISKRYGTQLVVLLVKPGLVPSGTHDRLELASEVIGKAADIGLPLRQLYLDPVITCRPDPFAWQISRGMPDIGSIVDTISFIRELQQGIRTIAALGNGTQGLSGGDKTALQVRMLQLLMQAGLDAVILNCLNSDLMQTARQRTIEHLRPDSNIPRCLPQ